MTVEEMREKVPILRDRAENLNGLGDLGSASAVGTWATLWACAAEICERLDRLAGEGEDGKG